MKVDAFFAIHISFSFFRLFHNMLACVSSYQSIRRFIHFSSRVCRTTNGNWRCGKLYWHPQVSFHVYDATIMVMMQRVSENALTHFVNMRLKINKKSWFAFIVNNAASETYINKYSILMQIVLLNKSFG